LAYYIRMAKELEKAGCNILAIKDMAGLLKPAQARVLVAALKNEIGLPIHLHTHDTSGIAGATILAAVDAGIDAVDGAMDAMSGNTSQPCLGSVVEALRHTPRDPGLDPEAIRQISFYWEAVRTQYAAFESDLKAGASEVYLHEMPGGQFTNLKEQARSLGLETRWHDVAKAYRAANDLFGDIVKVTPSSKVVGDMALFLFTRGIKPADVVNLPPGTSWPESVIDMLSGGLGEPMGGWPQPVVKAVLGTTKPKRTKPLPVKLKDVKAEVATKTKREPSDDDLFSHLMYPSVFADFAKFQREFSDVSALPTPAFFYGLKPGEEISVSIEEGKVLFIKLINVGTADKEGRRIVSYELNGMPREALVADKSIAPKAKSRMKADAADALQLGAPIPGMVTALAVSVGSKVAKGDRLVTLEAMKMQTTIYAQHDGVVAELAVAVGDSVDAGDLLVKLRA
jgi:pyruvate carboxylase